MRWAIAKQSPTALPGTTADRPTFPLYSRFCAPRSGAQKKEKARRSGGSVATSLLLVLTADCKARNAPRFASPSAAEANESYVPFQ